MKNEIWVENYWPFKGRITDFEKVEIQQDDACSGKNLWDRKVQDYFTKLEVALVFQFSSMTHWARFNAKWKMMFWIRFTLWKSRNFAFKMSRNLNESFVKSTCNVHVQWKNDFTKFSKSDSKILVFSTMAMWYFNLNYIIAIKSRHGLLAFVEVNALFKLDFWSARLFTKF